MMNTPRLSARTPEGIKSPVDTATTGNVSLRGLQTINGYQLEAKDRVLVKDQNEPADNGIYIALEHDWVRATDWKIGSQVANGVLVVDNNTGNVWRVSYNGTLFVGTTPVSFDTVVVAGNYSSLLNFDYLDGGLTSNEYDFSVGTVAFVKTYSATSGSVTTLWKKRNVTGPVSQLPNERLDLQCTDGIGAVWELLHTGEVFISSIGGDLESDNADVFRAFDNKAPYLNLEGKEWPCPGLSTDSGAQREILNSKVINGTLLITNSLSGETRAQTFAPYLESEAQLSETKSPVIDWTGLNVLWLGTSIPHQGAGVDGYPERVAEKLNFTVQNFAWSGSHIFYDVNGDPFNNGTIRALSMTEADRLAGLAQYGSSSTYDDSFDVVTKASQMTAEYRIKAQFENGPIDVVMLDHNHNDRKNVIEYAKNVKTVTGVTTGSSTTFDVDNAEGFTIGDGCYVRISGIADLDYAAGRVTAVGSNSITVAYDSSGFTGSFTTGEIHWVDRNTIKGAWDFIIAYIKNMGIRYGQSDVKIVLSGAPSYFTNNVNRDHSIWSVNRVIREVAESWQLSYFDVANALRLTYQDHINYLPDAVHPSTPETREVFTNVWATWMRNGIGNFYNPQEVLQRNKVIEHVHNQPALYSHYDDAFAHRDVIYTRDDALINEDFTSGLSDWTQLGSGTPTIVSAPWGSGNAVEFNVLANNTAPYLRQDVPLGTVPVVAFDFSIDDDTIATGNTQQVTIASINGAGGAGYSVSITQSGDGDLTVRATYNRGGFGQPPVTAFPNSSFVIVQDTKYRAELDVVDGYARFTIDGQVIFKGAIDNDAIASGTALLIGPTFTNMGSAFNLFIANVVAGAKTTQHVMTTEELQKTVQSYTLSELQAMSPTLTGRRVICSDRADAPLVLAPSGYVAQPGDIVAANGRVWVLQIDGWANVKWFGAVNSLTETSDAAFAAAFSRSNYVMGIGDFALSSGLKMEIANKHFVGAGKLGTRIRFLNLTGDCVTLGRSSKTINISFRMATIERLADATSGVSLQVKNVEDVSIDDVEIRVCYNGLNIAGCKNVTVDNTTIFSGTNLNKGAFGCRVGYSTDGLINGGKATSIFLNNVDVETRAASGVSGFVDGFFFDSSDGIWMDGCHSFNVDNCLTLQPGASSGDFFVGLWADSCYFDKCYEHNLRILGDATQFEDVTFNNCQFRAPAFNCVFTAANSTIKNLAFVAGTRFRKASTVTLNLAPTTPIEGLTISDCMIQLANDSGTASIRDVRVNADGFTYKSNKHFGGQADGTCLQVISGSDNFIVQGNVFTKSACGTKIEDLSGAVTKDVSGNLV